MLYIKIRWKHNDPDFPIILYSELDADRWEVRKIEQYADGRSQHAGKSTYIGDTRLGLVQIPSDEEIARGSEFEILTTDNDDFESAWHNSIRMNS